MNIEQPLYWSSPYQKELIATIIDVRGNEILLNITVFYPGGGGQPPDTGVLIYENHELRVTNVRKDEDGIWHKVETPKGLNFETNKEVILRVDWNRRYKLMKTHTAQHLISHFFKKLYGYDTLKANFWPGEIEIELDAEPANEEILKVLGEANKRIISGAEVKSIVVDQETFQKEYIHKVRGKISKEPIVRLIQLGDFDLVCCGGVHIKNLSEIKGIFFEAVKKRICKFLVDENGINFSNEQLLLLHALEKVTSKKGRKLVEFTQNKIAQNDELFSTAVQALKLIFKNVNSYTERIKDHFVGFFEFPELDRSILQNAIKELKSKVLLAIFGKNNTMYIISTDEQIPANDVVKAFIQQIGGRGGGNPKFAQVAMQATEDPIKIAKEVINGIISTKAQ